MSKLVVNDSKKLKNLFEKVEAVLAETENPFIIFSILTKLVDNYVLRLPEEYREGVYGHFNDLKARIDSIEHCVPKESVSG